MIPLEVENRIARYFFHVYLPDEVMRKVEDRLLSSCIQTEEKYLDYDELVCWAIDIINEQLENKRFK